MNNPRIRILESYLAEDPSDPFNYYALALENIKENPREATRLFDELLVKYPDYLPTYYSAGIFYAESQNNEKAMTILSAGIEIAKRQQATKTLRELQNALQNLDA